MSSSYTSSSPGHSFASLLRGFAQDPALPDALALDDELFRQFCREEGAAFAAGPDCVWTPALTLWTWLTQCLSASKSCVAAVARALVLRVASDQPPCAADSGAYCKARAKLPEPLLRRLALHVGNHTEDHAPDSWRFKGRRVLLADGAVCSMPDTAANQAEYPQPRSQKQGLGFPLIRLVVLLTFATAGLVGCALGPHQGKQTGEPSLFRALLEQLRRGDVVVADRYYCSYWLLALLLEAGVDVCFRLHQRRRCDFRRGQRLGRGDHVVSWHKPQRPGWMDEQTYAALPATLTVREVRVVVADRGCRSKQVIVATTLRDGAAYAKSDIAGLYHQRWHVELDIRAIKQTLQMDILSCKTPQMVRKEIWAHLLGYNLVRRVMARAAVSAQVTARQLSFAGAAQTVNAFRWALLLGEAAGRSRLVEALLLAVATHRVGQRPGRHEPRKVKRRPKAFPLLSKPRAQERAGLPQQAKG